MTSETPLLVVLSGPHGAGKSTFFEHFLRATGLFFVNGDILARAISPENPSQVCDGAAQVAAILSRTLVGRRETFCVELADPAASNAELLREAVAAGYRIVVVFVGLDGADVATARGAAFVDDVFASLKHAREFADELLLIDNSDADAPFRTIARLERGVVTEQHYGVPEWAVDVLRR